ncbi:MAG: Holliday junction branch migration protein RuvA [bacterium]|nr:Holliday junction branch migration protein RuvA [bacterium]
MIHHLSGTLQDKRDNYAVIDVGGVGFRVNIPLSTYRELPSRGETAFLHTVMLLREDDVQLYGFATEAERDLFNLFLGLSGVGGKVALDILSHLSVSLIVQAVQKDEPGLLCQAPGIGKKRAEKLIFELKRVKSPLLTAPVREGKTADETSAPPAPAAQEALDALMALGLKPDAAQRALNKALDAVSEEADASTLIKEALKHR